MKTILITGVSSGIGYGSAKSFVKHGYRVIGTVRQASDAMRLQAEWGSSFTPLLLDVTDSAAIADLAEKVTTVCDEGRLDGLINNAGMIIPSPLQLQSEADFRRQFEVNVLGLFAVTKALLPLLGATDQPSRLPGRIVNISSVGGQIAAPFISAYAATKHAVEGLSHSLRRELLIFGIKVIIIGPGSVKTAIWSKGGTHGANPSRGTRYEASMQNFQDYAKEVESQGFTPEEFGEMVREIFEKPNPKVRYALVPGKLANWTIPRLLPHLWLDYLLAQRLKLRKGS